MESGDGKRQHRDDWDRAASFWREHDESLRGANAALAHRLLELARIRPGHRVLDIASGTGEPGLEAARVVGPSGSVLLTDLSSEMLAVAREKAQAEGIENVDYRVLDAERLDLERGSFDAALCSSALSLMAKPVACLRGAHDALKRDGRIAVSVAGRLSANPYFTTAARVMRRYLSLPTSDPAGPGPFSLADPDHLLSVMLEAGFREPHVEMLEHPNMVFASGREYWDYVRQFSGNASLLARIPTTLHARIGEEVSAAAGGGDPDARVEFWGESMLASGVK